MNFLRNLLKHPPAPMPHGVVPYGKQKMDGTHDHRTNRGGDRTQAQKIGDKKRSKA